MSIREGKVWEKIAMAIHVVVVKLVYCRVAIGRICMCKRSEWQTDHSIKSY